ncbi:MAG: ribbon-helix-helix domain-containing protein [Solirubrobacteraceae bacterium MAG38_C4-C5]|nr:ribbon-helix-helix domain-containing protein [Candidatus Siliceabacter maunaloa]
MSRLLSVSVPDELLEQIEVMAGERGQTKSEFVRASLREQVLMERWRDLQREGRALAEARGIGPEDVERIVDAVRAERA